jgi:hypothetical protein
MHSEQQEDWKQEAHIIWGNSAGEARQVCAAWQDQGVPALVRPKDALIEKLAGDRMCLSTRFERNQPLPVATPSCLWHLLHGLSACMDCGQWLWRMHVLE